MASDGEPMREERKVVTALFADLVGSTALGEQLDPEDVREIVGGAIARVVEAVEAYGGTIKDLAGDGALALFGAPSAHEDDPERAVRAGLRIVEEIRAYATDVRREFGIQGPNVRVGIETGLVVLGPVGAGSRIEYGATGTAVNTTARLQAAAEPGSVFVGASTQRLVEPIFKWGAPHDLALKGKEERVTAYEALALRAVGTRVRGLRGIQAPLVGRDAEFAAVLRAGEALIRGYGSTVVITGEPGLGKSRLITELKDAIGQGCIWLEGRCVSYGSALPYWPFRELVRHWLRLSPAEPKGEARQTLRVQLDDLGLGDLYPYLGAVLDFGLDVETEGMLTALSPEALQFRTFEAIGALLRRLTADAPLVVAIEDLHWADPTSIQLVGRLLDISGQDRLLVVVTRRPERDHPSSQLVERATTVVTLEALPKLAERELVRDLLGMGTLPEAVEERLLETAEGNPFYLEELIRTLVDVGALVREEGRFAFMKDVKVEIPDTVEKIIVARIDRLSPSTRDVVSAASVLGRQFGVELLAAVARTTGRLTDALTELERLDLVRQEGDGRHPRYRFKHALTQEAVYNNLLRKERRRLHGAAADAIEVLFAERLEQHYGVLAHHRHAAGDLVRAVYYHELAADQARRVYSVHEALDHYSRALQLVAVLPEPDRAETRLLLKRGIVRAQSSAIAGARSDLEGAVAAARAAADAATELEALNELAFLLAGAADYREAIPLFEAALRIAEQIGATRAQVSLFSRLSIVYTNRLQLDQAVEYSEQALQLARGLDDRHAVSLALDSLEVASVMLGDFATVDEIAPELADIHRESGDLWYLQWAVYQWSWAATGRAHWELAQARLDEALTINCRIGDRGGEAITRATIAWVERSRGRYGPALERAAQALRLANEVGHPEATAWSEAMLGWTLLEIGAVAEACPHLDRAVTVARASGARIEFVRGLCHLARARWLLSERDELVDDAERELALVTAPSRRAYLQGADGAIAVARVFVHRGETERVHRLLNPILMAAQDAGWVEVVAAVQLTVGRPAEALAIAREHGLVGIEWEALVALGDEAAAVVADRLSSTIEDARIRQRFHERARREISGGRR